MTVGSAYEGANVDGPQELLNIARHHCQATQVNLRDMAYPSRSLSGRMSVGVQSDPTELAATQTADWPWVRAGVASTLNCTPDRR